MKGRPLLRNEWKKLIERNSPRNDELTVVRLLPLKLALMAGLRELEIALLPMNVIINSNGTLNEIIEVPEVIAHKEKERPVILTTELKADIEQYLGILSKYGVHSWPNKAHKGFNPNSMFVVDEQLKPYTVQHRGHTSTSKRVVAKGLNDHLDNLIANAGLRDVGINRKSLLRTFVIEAVKAGYSIKDTALMACMSQESVATTLTLDLEQYAPLSDYFTDRERRKQQRINRLKNVRRWTFGENE